MQKYDIAIIGAGAAGLTAGIYASRAGKKVAVFERLVAGGQIVNTPKIANYPATPGISGAEFSQALEKQAEDCGAEIIYEEIQKIEYRQPSFSLTSDEGEYQADALIMATGQSERKMGLANEAKFEGRGISYCATCDGNFYRDKNVIVVGGGNTALNEAIYLSGLAQKVYLVHRRKTLRAEQTLQDKARQKDNIELVLGYTPCEILEADKKFGGLKVLETEADGQPKESGETIDLMADGVFVAVGHLPENGLVSELIELDAGGYAVTDADCRTKTPGLFVAGDGRAKTVRQLVTATADGAIAAKSALEYLSER